METWDILDENGNPTGKTMHKGDKIVWQEEYIVKQDVDLNKVILKENNIPFIKKDEGSGSYLNISLGSSMQEKNVYVSSEDFEKASELINNIISQDNNENEKDKDKTEEEEDNSGKKYTIIRRVMGLLVLGFAITAIGVGVSMGTDLFDNFFIRRYNFIIEFIVQSCQKGPSPLTPIDIN